MRFFALAPLVALAIAQAADESSTGLAALTSSIDGELSSLSASASSVASSVSSAPTPEVTPTEEQKCISACPENDITCQAACVGVPAPNEQMINDTDKCARNCVQGNGTAEETEAFSNCVQGCISSSFLARPSTASSSSSGSGSNPTGKFLLVNEIQSSVMR